LPYQQAVLDSLKEAGLSPTGRTVVPAPEPQHFIADSGVRERSFPTSADLRRRVEKLGMFAALYSTPFPDKLCNLEIGYLQGFTFINSGASTPAGCVGERPPEDFNKAKTGKQKLEARLHKKNKPKVSSLLSKLVKKT